MMAKQVTAKARAEADPYGMTNKWIKQKGWCTQHSVLVAKSWPE
jgi:hypothetical protein